VILNPIADVSFEMAARRLRNDSSGKCRYENTDFKSVTLMK